MRKYCKRNKGVKAEKWPVKKQTATENVIEPMSFKLYNVTFHNT